MNQRLAPWRNAFPRRTRPLLMTALVVGDPFLEATRKYMNALVEGGADILELVLPFSDPAFHGAVMRRANERALSEKIGWEGLYKIIADFRLGEAEMPVIVTTYYNRLLATGVADCVEGLAAAGADGLMVMDLPSEEAGTLKALLEDRELALIQAVAPTTTVTRFRRIAKEAEGIFVWTGHCGTEVSFDPAIFDEQMRKLRQFSEIPLVASMNIESGEDARKIARSAHGVLVGSSLAWLVEGGGPDVEERLRTFVADLRINLDAVDED